MSTTGSGNVMAQLVNLAKRDRLPCVRMPKLADKPTASGFRPYWLVTPEGVREPAAAAGKGKAA